MQIPFLKKMSDTSTLIDIQVFRGGAKKPTPPAAFRSAGDTSRAWRNQVEQHRLIRLRQAIVEGFYQVDPRRIACKLLKRD